jgi:hypothetical protein
MKILATFAACMAALLLTGCSPSTAEPALPIVKIHKNASCGCCKVWVERLRAAGFQVEANDVDNMQSIKERVGLPYGMGSCHTAEVDGYFVEGHVPVDDIKRLLRERPKAKGLAVPGMPAGSPGMEVPSGKVDAYDVMLIAPDGKATVYAHHGEPK